MKKQFFLSCILITCLAGNLLYAPDAADPFEELFKGIDFEKIARDLGLSDEMFDAPKSAFKDTDKQPDASDQDLRKSKQEPSSKEIPDKEKKEFIKKDQKTLFLESNVKPGPEKSSKEMSEELSREKKEAFKQVMNNIITHLKNIEINIDQSFPVIRDAFFAYKSKIDIFVAATELMQRKRLYLNFFFLPLYDKLRKDIYSIKTDLQKLNDKIQAQIKKQPAQDIAKLAKDDNFKFQKIALLTPTKKALRGSKESNGQDTDVGNSSSDDTVKTQNNAIKKPTTQLSKETVLQRDITPLFTKKFIPITQELEKMLSSPAYKEALKKRTEERDKIAKESERNRERSGRGYSSSSSSYRPRRYRPDSDSYDSSYRRPSRSYWDSSSHSSWDSPSSYGSSANKPFGADSVTSKDSSPGKSSSPETSYEKGLSKKEVAAKKLAENLFKKIALKFTQLTKAKKPLKKSTLEALAAEIKEKDAQLNKFIPSDIDDDAGTKKATPKVIVAKPKDYKQICQAFLPELVKNLGPDKLTTASDTMVDTLFSELEKYGETSKATIKQKLGERTNEFLNNKEFIPALRELKKTSLEHQKNLDAAKAKLKISEKNLEALNKKVPVVANDVTKEKANGDTIKKSIEDYQKKYTETQKTSDDLWSKLKDFTTFNIYGGDTRPEHQANALDKALENTKIPPLAK
ncbi:MAG: hypothetical protein ABH827_02155 [bacterium]